MRNLWTLIQREYLERVRTRSFVIFTLLMPAAMAGIVIIPSKIAEMNTGGERRLVIVANDPKLGAGVAQELTGGKSNAASDDPGEQQQQQQQQPFGSPITYAIAVVGDTSDAERDRLNKEVMDGKITGFLWLTNDALAGHQILYSTKEAADFGQSSDLRNAVRTAVTKERLQQRGMNDTEIGSLLTPIRLETVRVEKGKQGTSGVTVFLTAFSMVFLLYVVVLVYGMAVMRSVIEEKSTRILEVLLSCVTAKELLAGKILGIGAVGLTQVLVWVIFATIFSVPGLVAAKSFLGAMHIPVVGMFAFAIFFLLGYLLYSSMYAAIGSMVNTDQEAQQMQWPAMEL
jgi:ABC-2 type transport system permease protein